jgi:hypothetical protein
MNVVAPATHANNEITLSIIPESELRNSRQLLIISLRVKLATL